MRARGAMMAIACAGSLLALGEAWAQPASAPPAASRYPTVSAWLATLAEAVPPLQECVSATGAPGPGPWQLLVAPTGAVTVLDGPVVATGEDCFRPSLEGLRFPPHDEETLAIQVVFPVRAGTVSAPVDLRLPERETGPLFLHLRFDADDVDRRRTQEAVDQWLSGASPPPSEGG